MGERGIFGLFLGSLALVYLAGCSSFDGQQVRREHAAEYPATLRDETEGVLSQHDTLGLEDCIRIAMSNNLETQSAAIQERIARLQRKVAFADFLPAVSLSYSHYEFDPAISLPLSETEPMNIDKARALLWSASVSVFSPATWFLYGMHERGEEIAEWVVRYTRQMVAQQVTVLYFQCLTLEQVKRSLAAEEEAAEALRSEVAALHQEGLVSGWQADQAAVYAQAQRAEMARTQRLYEQAKSALLAAMGLSPLADVTLASETPIDAPAGSLEELILEAMLCHPSLHIADRRIAIEKEKVKLAIANFLPVLGAFAYRPDALETSLLPSNQWIYGLAGTLTLFDGFANINEYKAARQRQEQAFIEREQATLALMLAVIRAQQNVETAQDQLDLAERAMDVASRRYAETQEKWKEGLIDSVGFLQGAAERAKAQMQVLAARFQHQVAGATLLNAMGKTETDIEEPRHEGQS